RAALPQLGDGAARPGGGRGLRRARQSLRSAPCRQAAAAPGHHRRPRGAGPVARPGRVEMVIPSPNIWRFPDRYEIENAGADPESVIEAAMRSLHDWAGQALLDIGCGTG